VNNATVKILCIALLISFLGIFSIYSNTHQRQEVYWQLTYQRQLFWLILGILIFVVMFNVNYRHLWDWTYILYGAALVLLFLVFILGLVRLGAQRWIRIAWFNFQPSEIVKLVMIILFSRYFSAKSADDIYLKANKFGILRGICLPLLFLSIPVGLIAEQPDLGSAVMMLFIFISMAFLGNVRLRNLVIFLLVIVLLMPFAWHYLKDYQKERLAVFLDPNIDPLGAGYTIIQSKIAIGSGGLFGKGWLSGTQSQLHFLPESHTDFIFATFVEEWGLFGGFMLMFLYFLLIRQGLMIAERTHDQFGRLLALGISFMLGCQVIVNIAMNAGLAPVVGLPLPLMSYGGSSIFITFMSLGILANINKTRAVF
jgi:rod shape determining protein RodA